MNKFYSYEYLEKKYGLNTCGISNQSKRDELEKKGYLKSKKINGRIVYCEEVILRFYNYTKYIKENYYTIKEFFKVFSEGVYPENYKYQIKFYREILKQVNIELVTLDFYLDVNNRHFVSKKDYENFKEKYISINEYYKQFSNYYSIEGLMAKLRSMDIEIIKFKNKYNYRFIFIERKITESTSKHFEGIRTREFQNLLKLPQNKFYEVLKKYNVKIHNSYINKKEADSLLKLQKKIKEEFDEKYLTLDDAMYIFNDMGYINKNDIDNSITRGDIPVLISNGKYRNKKIAYLKTDFENFYTEKKERLELIDIFDNAHNFSGMYEHFQAIINLKNCHFGKNKITEESWFMYVKNSFNNTTSNNEFVRTNLVRTLVKVTEFLTVILNDKEIFSFSEKELNLLIFNDNTPVTYKQKIRHYLTLLNASLLLRNLKPIRIEDLNYKKNQMSITKKDYYLTEEFLIFYDQINDYKKIRPIIIADLCNGNIKKYKKYDSLWMYMLMHLSNGWRSSDIQKLHRMDDEIYDSLMIKGIEDLTALEISIETSLKIVNSIKQHTYLHNKTGELAQFYIPEALAKSFAYAAIFCEFRQRNFQVIEDEKLINFYSKSNVYTKKLGTKFLNALSIKFDFSSLKMNRTLLSIYSSIARHEGQDTIYVPKHLRGHINDETTKHYIEIREDEINLIIKKLFETDTYGYVYNSIAERLNPAKKNSQLLLKSDSKMVKLIFGDILKLENLAITFDYLKKRQFNLNIYLDKLSQEELFSKLKLIKLNLGYSKDQNYQCFFKDCITENSDCSLCPFAIPNFYSIGTLVRRIKKNLSSYLKEEKNGEAGELIRLYKLLVNDYALLIEAEEKFGIEIIEHFLENELTSLDNKLMQLNDPLGGILNDK